ncbi:MAG: hypothetical protein ACI9QC_000781 [Oceanicoccus sp.]|jgi:hypothetical protein
MAINCTDTQKSTTEEEAAHGEAIQEVAKKIEIREKMESALEDPNLSLELRKKYATALKGAIRC